MLIECSCVSERQVFKVAYCAIHLHLLNTYYAPGATVRTQLCMLNAII